MKKLLSGILCLFLFVSGYSQAAGVFVKYPSGLPKDSIKVQGDTTSSASGWVHSLHDPHFNDISITGGNTGSITFKVNHLNWLPFAGNSAFPNNGVNTSGFYPAAVMAESWYNNDFAFDSTKEQFSLNGLLPSKTYAITFSASNAGTGFSDSTVFRVLGTGTTVLGPYRMYSGNNTAVGITVPTAIQPDATGRIRFYVNTDVTTGGNHLSFFSGITATEQ